MKGLGMRLPECSLTLPQGLHSGSLESGHTQQMLPPPPFVLLLSQHGEVLSGAKDILPTNKIAKLSGRSWDK